VRCVPIEEPARLENVQTRKYASEAGIEEKDVIPNRRKAAVRNLLFWLPHRSASLFGKPARPSNNAAEACLET
jgi:hypothetical protein